MSELMQSENASLVDPYRLATSVRRERESERLLALAEALQDKREATLALTKQRENWYSIGLMICLSISVMGALSVASFRYPEFNADGAIVQGFTVGFSVLSFGVVILGRLFGKGSSEMMLLRDRIRRDERALSEVVQILRESQGSLVQSEQWSTLQQAEFRIRLARFDIGPDSGLGRIEAPKS